jgi:hypothetical protein
MTVTEKSFVLLLFKRILDLGIAIFLIFIPIVIATGGFKGEFFGISLSMSHVYTPLRILIPLIFIRLLITINLKNFLLLIVSVFAGLLFAELALRVWDPPMASPKMAQIHRPSNIFNWELVPKSFGVGGFGESYLINSAGFRDREYELKKPPGKSRIMVIGDSFTFGPSINLENTYPKQLEQILKSKGIPCEVINCGVIGYQMWQHVEVLKRKVLPYQPEMVILGLFLDDITFSVPPYKNPVGREGYNPFAPKGTSEIMAHSSLFNYLWNLNYRFEAVYRYRRGYGYLQGIKARNEKFGPKNPDKTWHKVMYGKLKKQKYEDFKKALKNFISLSRAKAARVLVVMIPDAAQLHDPDKQAINRFVAQSCREIGVPFVDTTPILEKEKNPRLLYLFPKDAHNSPKGYRLIAQTAAEKIMVLGLLTPGKKSL